jgi:four helix bundle protein
MSEAKSPLKSKSFAFAIRCVNLYKHLVESKKEFVLSKQLLRSGTSIGANIREAQNAQSTADFIHKLSISQKECDETLYWLELLVETKFISKGEFDSINSEALELLKMLRSAIITTKKNIS